MTRGPTPFAEQTDTDRKINSAVLQLIALLARQAVRDELVAASRQLEDGHASQDDQTD